MIHEIYSADALEIKNDSDINSLSKKLLLKKGLSEKECEKFLNPSLSDLTDPFLIDGIKDAVDRIKSAIEKGESIIVIGDYDVDGITSAFMLTDGLKNLGANILYTHIPDRYKEGYGLKTETLEILAENFYPDIIITVDCGISAIEEVEFLKNIGIDVIITDHHTPGNILPDCIIVNPKVCGVSAELSGAGVVFKLLCALNKNIAFRYLEFAALSTVSDLMPLLGENRIIVKYGLKQMANTKNTGLKTLLRFLNLQNIEVYDVGFKIAPRLNAPARVDGDTFAYNLFAAETESEAMLLCEALEKANAERQTNVKKSLDNALRDLASYKLYSKKIIILKGNYDIGILGLVAQKLAVEFCRPVIILTMEDEFLKGSCRSIDGIDIYEMLFTASDFLISFGGHKKAAGVTLKKEDYLKFVERMEQFVNNYPIDTFIPKNICNVKADYLPDCELFYNEIEKLEPFGMDNFRPSLNICGSFGNEYLSLDKKHLLLQSNGQKMKFWNGSKMKSTLDYSKQINLMLTAGKNFYNKISYDYTVRFAEPQQFIPDETAGQISLLNAFINNEEVTSGVIDSYELLNNLQNPFGTVLIAFKPSTFIKYRKILEENKIIYYAGASDYLTNNYNVLLYCPEKTDYLYHKKTVLLDKPQFNPYLFSKIMDSAESFYIYGDFSRERFSKIYLKLITLTNKDYRSPYNFYKKFFENEGFTIGEFYLALKVFEELGFIKVGGDFTLFKLNSQQKDLKTSKLYLKILKYLV